MKSSYMRIILASALSFVFATGQIFLPVSVAATDPTRATTSSPPQQITAILTTNSNQPIQVNGAGAVSGATILTGATLETPDRVAASTSIPGHALLEILQRTKLVMTFDQDSIKVTLIYGCVVLHTMKGTSGQVVKEDGHVLGRSDNTKAGVINVCETSGLGTPPPKGANTALILLLAAGGAAALIIPLANRGNRGTNPSPFAP
jgi:hypothetical protein